jgi:hypothetical protein
MNRFLIKLNFQIRIADDNSRFDEQLRVIDALNEEEAIFKGVALGRSEETLYLNNEAEEVNWKFLGITDVLNVTAMKSGEMVSERLSRKTDHASYTAFLKKKSIEIQVKSVSFV